MIRRIFLIFAASALPASPWQSELPPELMNLAHIKLQMSENLARIPNYTCLETVSRLRRGPERLVIAVPGKSVPFRRVDVLRFEVAEIGGMELFAGAGEHNFEKKEIAELASTGLIGNGMFSAFAHDVFLTNAPKFQFAGDESLDGRRLLRYDFTVPQLTSGYNVGTNLGAAEVGYHGSFWADPQSFDAVRLDIIADEIPRYVGLAGASNRIDYALVRIGSANVLLPQSGELQAREVQGWESRNQISFTHCREYGVESMIRFDDAEDSGDGTPGGVRGTGTSFTELPPGLTLAMLLETPIDGASSRVGDLISARVELDAKYKGKVAVPKDAIISGRLRRMEVHREGWPYILAGMEFTQVEFAGKQARFFAELEKIVLPPGAEGPKKIDARDLPGVGVVTQRGNRLRLPKDTRMLWKTISYADAADVGK